MSNVTVCDKCKKVITGRHYVGIYEQTHTCQACHTGWCWNCTNNPNYIHKYGDVIIHE